MEFAGINDSQYDEDDQVDDNETATRRYTKEDIATKVRPAAIESLVEKFLPKSSTPDQQVDDEIAINTGTHNRGRWKFAFKDLSKGKDAETLIRTRDGILRPANAWELSQRSWGHKPRALDI